MIKLFIMCLTCISKGRHFRGNTISRFWHLQQISAKCFFWAQKQPILYSDNSNIFRKRHLYITPLSHSRYVALITYHTLVYSWLQSLIFQMVKEEGDFYSWARPILVPNLYYTETYNGVRQTHYDENFLGNMYAYRLGPPRLRQVRVSKGWLISLIFQLEYRSSPYSISWKRVSVSNTNL